MLTPSAFVPVFLAIAAFGCASTSSMLAQRFAKERTCDVDDVRVTERSAQEYVADGCGRRAEYICESFSGMNADETRCRELGGADKRPPDDKFRGRKNLEPPK